MSVVKDVPAGYKQTEIGVIPEDWETKKFSEIFFKIQDGTHFSPKIRGGEYLYITSKNIRKGYIDLSQVEYIDRIQHEVIFSSCAVQEGDILLTKDGANTGNAAINTISNEISLLSSVAFLRAEKQKNCHKFFLQQILANNFQKQIRDELSGNAITRLTLQKINKLKGICPPFLEQKAIAKVLSDTDALIESLDQLIAKKKAIKQGAMQELLTGKRRLPGFAKSTGYKLTELGVIPEDWEVKRLGDLAKIFRGASPRPIESPIWFDDSSHVAG
jgi:type I restriction enzyme S subunit